MATDREIEELIARCVGIMVFYRNIGNTTQSRGQMVAEIRAVACRVKEWQAGGGVVGRIHDSVKAEMIARFGHELGMRLGGEFYESFEGVVRPIPIRSPSMARC